MFEEIEQVLIPKNSSDELKQSLKDNDIPFIEYQKSHIFDDAYGRQPLIESMKEYQFQLAPDFKSDSNGTELNDDQLRPIMLSRALDANGNIKLVTHNGREGYYDIRRPLDTRKRNVRSMAEDYANRYGMEFDGLFNAKDAKSFLSLANSNGYDFDGIVYKDGTEVGYVPAMDSQFFPSDSIEFTGKLLKEMKDRTGMYEDLDKQVQDAKRSADLQIIQANIDYYQNGFKAYEELNRNPEELLVTNEEFKEIYDEAIKRVEEYELENIERRNRMFVEQGMSAEYIEEFNKENLETLEEDKKNMLQEVYDNYIDSNRKPFEDDYANYMKWQDIKALHEGFAPEPFVDARGFKQYPISDYEIEQGRKRFHIPVLSQYEAQQIIDKTIENMQKTSRYAEDFEMVDPKTLILFKDYDRLSRPSYEENFKRTFDSIREKGFIEPVWITANYQTGFTYLGEGNHRVYIALMAGIDRVPAVVSRHNYDEPRLIERQGYAIGLSNGGYIDVNGIQKQDSMMKPSELSDVFKFQKALSAEQEAFFKDSKVRDENGNLLTVYHGTDNEFNSFDLSKVGTNFIQSMDGGFFFTNNKKSASSYGKNIKEVHLNIVKPLIIDQFENGDFYYNASEIYDMHRADYLQEAKTNDNDGIIIKHKNGNLYVTFDSNQVKLTDNLSPTSSLDIRFQRELSPEQNEFFMKSKVRDKNGNLLKMYHGTPSGAFTKFKSGSYFTSNKEYADKYQNTGASSISTNKTIDNPKTYEVYLNIEKPFDTRIPEIRKIFEEEYYRKYGMGSPLTERGLPDWLDGIDLQEFIEEKGYDFDGLILDEGATGGYGEAVESRGISYVIFNPNQVKNVDNLTPTSSPDIRFQLNKEQTLFMDNVVDI